MKDWETVYTTVNGRLVKLERERRNVQEAIEWIVIAVVMAALIGGALVTLFID